MLAFILLASRLGRPVAGSDVAKCTRYDMAELAFEPDQYLGWHSKDRRLYLFAWQAFAEQGQIGSHWHVDRDEVVLFSGMPVPLDTPWTPGVGWADQLAERIAASDANTGRRRAWRRLHPAAPASRWQQHRHQRSSGRRAALFRCVPGDAGHQQPRQSGRLGLGAAGNQLGARLARPHLAGLCRGALRRRYRIEGCRRPRARRMVGARLEKTPGASHAHASR